MTLRRVPSRWFVLPLLVALIVPQGLFAQQDKVAALKQSLSANEKLQKQYRWVETTVISLKGEEKSRIQKQCFYGPDGKVQKQQLTAPPQESAPGGMKGKIAAKKKEEITATMKQAVALVQSYVPPDPQRIQAVKTAGNLAMNSTGPDSIRLDLRNYVKSGDTLSLGLDTARNAIQTVSVKSYLESEKDAITLEVTFARLREGLSYPGNIVLNVPGEKIQVVVQNSNYQRVTPAPPPKPAKPNASEAALDTLTGPIALYPDALVAQILEGSKDVAAVQKFAGWLKTNSALKGTELQDAAQKAGFAAPYIALAPFPQVVQMMVEKPDWTRQLGAAYTSDEQAVYQSIQRLRAAAMALGNLKTTPQQEVVTDTSSTGQTIILVQPANPQVVYVPVYNTQVVYVQPAPPPPPPSASSSDVAAAALVGFTVGIIIGASSNHYYYGPYAWHGGGAAYHYAYERREDYVDHRQDMYSDRQDFRQDSYNDRQDYRQDNAPQNQAQRQSAAQTNQSQRQTAASSPTAQANQSARQSTAQTNQSARQTTASSGSGGTGATAQANQANRQSTAQSSQSSRRSTASTSGYQSGGAARAQSARGSSSRASSRSGGGSSRRR
jgi:hypothetical protein